MIRELETVALTHDIPEHSLKEGDIGAVVHCYEHDDTYEIEKERLSHYSLLAVQIFAKFVGKKCFMSEHWNKWQANRFPLPSACPACLLFTFRRPSTVLCHLYVHPSLPFRVFTISPFRLPS
jgi:hypothetical protein